MTEQSGTDNTLEALHKIYLEQTKQTHHLRAIRSALNWVVGIMLLGVMGGLVVALMVYGAASSSG